MPVDLLAEEMTLRGGRRPYVTATVVWAQHPTAGHTGDRALVTDDGRMLGWVGGSCTEPVVVQEALRALAEGSPRLLRVGSPDRPPVSRAGVRVVAVPVACASEGELEVLVQPWLPAPRLVAVGAAPMLDALVEMAGAVGYEATRVERGPAADDAADATSLAGLGLGGLGFGGLGAGDFVVVATFGRYDEDALEEALASEAGYVGLVASAKRAGAVLSALREAGTPEDRLARVRAPAGLDLGPTGHLEIAVAVLADIVSTRAIRRATAEPAEPGVEAVDPVCGMSVAPSAADRATHGGIGYVFCSAGCRRRFEAEPERFVASG